MIERALTMLFREHKPHNPLRRHEYKPYNRSCRGDDFGGEIIVCRGCGQQITSDTQRVSVVGAHEHTFSNPEGILFHIGCFGRVQGCQFRGVSTGQWSWFKGYQWRVTYCAECGLHLGWCFSSGEHVFHGFVLRNRGRLS